MKIVLGALALALLTPVSAAAPVCAQGGSGYACCKVCKKGKACGDSCIARNATCTKPRGCACDG